ncbi:MAG: 16S rRNA (guanine(966)-N(2))-methyltransferase RsmD [Neisseriaceae bacterium]|nr:16S rRNA (guanine(966)-N(2))-methyltransferase RsmD [Neisseriaceae bacterium]
MYKNPNHRNRVRIIGGECKSRIITFPDIDGLRPTADMVREKLFNWLGQNLYGKSVLDLFSGSGVMGFEAASRYAKHVVLIEKNRKALTYIQNNIKELKLNNLDAFCIDAFDYLQNNNNKFDIVLLDPPYAWNKWNELWKLLTNHLNNDAEIYIEAASHIELPNNLISIKQGKSGNSHFTLARFTSETISL